MCVFGHPIKDFIPIPPGRYSPHNTWRETLDAREEALRNRHIKQGERLSEHTKRLPQLATGDCVRIQNQIGHYPLKWDKTGIIIEVRQFDQYAVKVDGSGRVTLRNRKFLRKYVPVKGIKTTKTIQDDLCYKNVPVPSSFDTKQVLQPTSDTLMETPKDSTRERHYPLGQATSDSKDSSTPEFTYSQDLPSEQKLHILETPKTGLSSSKSPRVENTHPERRRLEFTETPFENQGTQPTTNTPPLIITPTELNPQRKSSRASRPPAWHSDYSKSEDTWTCPSCSKPNNSSTKVYFIPSGDDSKHTSFNISTNPLLLDSISDSSIPSTSGSSINSPSFNTTSFSTDIPIMTSSPKPAKTKPTPKKQLRLLNINFQSLRKKGKLLEAIIESTDPDIIIGTETWLDPNIKSSEIFPDYLQYDIERRDRPKDPHGGVLIAAKQTLQLGNITKSGEIELLTGTIALEGKKKMLIGAFYRPPDKTDDTYLNTVKEEISTIKSKQSIKIPTHHHHS
ncbi:unnamed protein product [Mytilus edulis]|uniref:Endonuclease/exonuclease/phosphatase domain-containing protein n=1 Tax=Mytilus edulis TaxID=6550 RepID=A0A8S3RES2_MYTED|nr:unnamed protein product [Mytilus edulis]